MLRVVMLVILILAATPADAAQCYIDHCYDDCWVDAYNRLWCQRKCVEKCYPDEPHYSPARGGGDGGFGLLILALIAWGIAAALSGDSYETPSDEVEFDEEEISIDELTERVETAAREADAYIGQILARTRQSALTDETDESEES